MNQDIRNYDAIFPVDQRNFWKEIVNHIERITEIRIRAGKPVLIYLKQKEVSMDFDGNLVYVSEKGKKFSYKELQELVNFWCMDSRYAFQDEIKRGFLTIQGGHRIGICGEVVSDRMGNLQTIKYISSINIRIAHEIKNVSDQIMPYLVSHKGIENTLIISPPGAGKTTLLRDIIRQLSYGNEKHRGINVGVVDERGEIAACFQGIPQLDVGPRTDVLDNCPKSIGMRMLLRSMSPGVVAVDELGNSEEIELIQQMIGNGCGVIATIHGESMEELKHKRILSRVWENGMFQNLFFLSRDQNQFHIAVYKGRDGKLCYKC